MIMHLTVLGCGAEERELSKAPPHAFVLNKVPSVHPGVCLRLSQQREGCFSQLVGSFSCLTYPFLGIE